MAEQQSQQMQNNATPVAINDPYAAEILVNQARLQVAAAQMAELNKQNGQ